MLQNNTLCTLNYIINVYNGHRGVPIHNIVLIIPIFLNSYLYINRNERDV